jgi:hypothetical protein
MGRPRAIFRVFWARARTRLITYLKKTLKVDPDTPIAPGSTQDLKLTITSPLFHQERLIPINDPQNQIAGLLAVEDDTGQRQNILVQTGVVSLNLLPGAGM